MIIKSFKSLVAKAPVPYTQSFAQKITKKDNSSAGFGAYGAVSTLFSVVNRLANDTSAVDWKLYQKSGDKRRKFAWDDMDSRKEIDRNHPVTRVLNNPNPFMTRQELFETAQQHLDLVGEAFLYVDRNNFMRVPAEIWPLNPLKMSIAVDDWKEYITGYVYKDSNGHDHPFEVDEIIHLRMPNPADPYRGLSPVGSLVVDLDSHRLASEHTRSFFLNDATPGGVIEFPEGIDDRQFNSIKSQWNEKHRGVRNAYKIGIIEGGKWVSTSFSMKDMQFVELKKLSSDTIREAYGFPKFKQGIVEDVNRATAEASEFMYAKSLLIPRLERIKQAFNMKFLPMFGDSVAQSFELDYCNPVPEDKEFEMSSLKQKVEAAKVLIDLGFEPDSVLETVGLPAIEMKEVEDTPSIPETPSVSENETSDDDTIDTNGEGGQDEQVVPDREQG